MVKCLGVVALNLQADRRILYAKMTTNTESNLVSTSYAPGELIVMMPGKERFEKSRCNLMISLGMRHERQNNSAKYPPVKGGALQSGFFRPPKR